MNPYFWLPLLSGLACLAFAVLIVAREPWATTNRLTGVILAGGAWWGCCDALWTLAPDAASALYLVRLSAPGWIFVGPLALHLLLDQAPGVSRGLRRLVPSAYGVAALALAAEWAAPSLHAGAVPVAWGWGYLPTRIYAAWYVFTIGCALLGGYYALARIRASSPAERGQSPWLQAALGVPVLLGSVTDGLLPLLGVQVPRLGPASFAVLGGLIAWSIHRFGYSVFAPGSFAAPILASLRDGVALATPDGRIRFANPGLAALLDLPLAELSDQPLERFLAGAPLAPLRELSEVECELSGGARGPVPVALSTSLLRDRRGMLIGVVLVIRDLREVVGLRTRLLTSARLAAVGQLAAGIAHEINNPLAYIGANLRALREQWLALAASHDRGAASEGRSRPSTTSSRRASRCSRNPSRASTVPPPSCATCASSPTAAARPRSASIRTSSSSAPCAWPSPTCAGAPASSGSTRTCRPWSARAGSWSRCCSTSLINAAQAIEGVGTVRVATSRCGDEVEITVSDTGCGIPVEVMERIFDPFFTTKPVGEGTGLGLSISYEIVRRHGGRILVDSVVGRGTEVRVRLPAGAARSDG